MRTVVLNIDNNSQVSDLSQYGIQHVGCNVEEYLVIDGVSWQVKRIEHHVARHLVLVWCTEDRAGTKWLREHKADDMLPKCLSMDA